MKPTLYFAPISCALVPYITLTEAQADFDVHSINIRGQDQWTAEYLRLNPKHKVPLLVVDGAPLSENVAIQLWIARSFPKANLLPTDIWAQAQTVSLLAWFASGIHPNISRYHAPRKFCDVEGTEDNVKAIAGKALIDGMQIAESMLTGRDFFMNHFTAADAYFFWVFRRSNLFGIDWSEFRACFAHQQRMLDRQSVQTAIAYEKSQLERFNLTP